MQCTLKWNFRIWKSQIVSSLTGMRDRGACPPNFRLGRVMALARINFGIVLPLVPSILQFDTVFFEVKHSISGKAGTM